MFPLVPRRGARSAWPWILLAGALPSLARAEPARGVDGGALDAGLVEAHQSWADTGTPADRVERRYDGDAATSPSSLPEPSPSPPEAASGVADITVVGRSKAQRTRESADAVNVVEL